MCRIQTGVRIVAVLATVALVAGCVGAPSSSGGGPASPPQEPTDLGRTEILEYKGMNLSSVGDFRENSIKGPQDVDRESYRLTVDGLVSNPLELDYESIVKGYPAYEKVVTLNCVEGWSVDILWEGIRVADLLDDAGADSSARVVIFRSADGYSTSLPADFIRERDILMAHKMNGIELPPERGFPFQLVAEERWGYKWAKWITQIEVSDDTSFEGYWESRGYSNDGDLNDSYRD